MMKTLITKTKTGIDLLDTQLAIDNSYYTVGGKIKEEFHDGLLYQWWILIDEKI